MSYYNSNLSFQLLTTRFFKDIIKNLTPELEKVFDNAKLNDGSIKVFELMEIVEKIYKEKYSKDVKYIKDNEGIFTKNKETYPIRFWSDIRDRYENWNYKVNIYDVEGLRRSLDSLERTYFWEMQYSRRIIGVWTEIIVADKCKDLQKTTNEIDVKYKVDFIDQKEKILYSVTTNRFNYDYKMKQFPKAIGFCNKNFFKEFRFMFIENNKIKYIVVYKDHKYTRDMTEYVYGNE